MMTSGDKKCLQFAVTSGKNGLKFVGYWTASIGGNYRWAYGASCKELCAKL